MFQPFVKLVIVDHSHPEKEVTVSLIKYFHFSEEETIILLGNMFSVYKRHAAVYIHSLKVIMM